MEFGSSQEAWLTGGDGGQLCACPGLKCVCTAVLPGLNGPSGLLGNPDKPVRLRVQLERSKGKNTGTVFFVCCVV